MEDNPNTRAHGNRRRRPVPMRRQLVRLILLQVVDNNNGTIRLIPIFGKFSPSDLGAIVAEDRSVDRTLFPRGNFLTILTLEIDDVNLGIQLATQDKPRSSVDSRSAWCATRVAGWGPTWYTRRGSWRHQNRPSLRTVQRENSRAGHIP